MSSPTASENGSARATPKDSDEPTTRKKSERNKSTPPKSPATSRCDSIEAAASTSTPSSKYKAIEKVATPPPLPEGRPNDHPSTYEHERDGNELKVCQFVQYDSSNKALAPIIIHNWRATDPVPTTAVPQPIYRMRTFPLVEIGTKRLLFHVAKTVAQHGKLFTILPILLVALSFIGPIYYRDRITLHAPFGTFIMPNSDPTTTVPVSTTGARSANGYRSPSSSPFNGTNPQFDTPDRNLYSDFSVLISTRSPYGSILSNHSLSTYNELVDAIHNMTLVQSSFSLKWPDVCRTDCSETNPIMRYLQERRLFLKYPEALATFETGEPKHTYIANLIGDVDLDSEGIVSRARSILLTLRLKDNLRAEVFDNFDRQLQAIVGFLFSVASKTLI
ncbi:Protein F43D9.1 [Aphelenchoides avenae]|nr:Protein F43D9.1 [Aphelenchus avenae]